jgi:hypothetical protein
LLELEQDLERVGQSAAISIRRQRLTETHPEMRLCAHDLAVVSLAHRVDCLRRAQVPEGLPAMS